MLSGSTIFLYLGISIFFLRKSDDRAFLFKLIARKKWVLPLISIPILILCIEFGFRLLKLAEYGGGEGPLQIPQRDGFYQMNSMGQRGPDVPLKKNEGSFVILGLGDSVLFGQGVEWDKTVLQQVMTMLKEKHGINIVTINSGLPGANTVHQANFYSRFGYKYNPDLLIIQFTLNDPETTLYKLKGFTHSNWEKKLIWRSHLFFYLVRKYNESFHSYRDHIFGLYGEEFDGWLKCKNALMEIKNISDREKTQSVLVIYPLLEDMKSYVFSGIHDKIRKFAELQGYSVIDLYEDFKGYDGPIQSLRVSQGDSHPNAKAHNIAAKRIVTWITHNSLIGRRGTKKSSLTKSGL